MARIRRKPKTRPKAETPPVANPLPALITLKEFTKWAGLGPTVIKGEMWTGRLPSVRINGRIYVRTADASAWLASLPNYFGFIVD